MDVDENNFGGLMLKLRLSPTFDEVLVRSVFDCFVELPLLDRKQNCFGNILYSGRIGVQLFHKERSFATNWEG